MRLDRFAPFGLGAFLLRFYLLGEPGGLLLFAAHILGQSRGFLVRGFDSQQASLHRVRLFGEFARLGLGFRELARQFGFAGFQLAHRDAHRIHLARQGIGLALQPRLGLVDFARPRFGFRAGPRQGVAQTFVFAACLFALALRFAHCAFERLDGGSHGFGGGFGGGLALPRAGQFIGQRLHAFAGGFFDLLRFHQFQILGLQIVLQAADALLQRFGESAGCFAVG
ncbi:MAG: hypothetical protein BWZ10_03149 [candidate division BRC1 bacterium ADurb.BinA364]|nr:MAG: hypothetical protein BWZ10_03149 [candidate division BRC1 bacterium ADurb.BinA364]